MSGRDIEHFSIWARRELQTQIELRAAHFGIADGGSLDGEAWEVRGCTLSSQEHAQRASLVAQVQARGYAAVMEEATYTWFNRLVALRFMDANGYLECGASWFTTPGQAGFRPEVLVRAQELNLPGLDEAVVDNYRRADDEEGLYRYLFDLQCSALSHALPRMFSPLEDWTQLLCPANLLRETGVLSRMVQDIPEEDWRREVEIVGWMYQFYNEGSKAEVYARLKKGRKVETVDIAPATQLFTPDWIVRYLVQNSLGRLWMNLHPQSQLAKQMEYYAAPAQKPAACLRVDSPEELKICDPACGSGHMLTYAFDLLYAIYEEEGYASADIPALILRHNLYGIDLDQRAGDLAYFALMMKARARDRRFLRRGVQPRVRVLCPLVLGQEELAAYVEFIGASFFSASMLRTLRQFEAADIVGSLICPEERPTHSLLARLEEKAVDLPLELRPTHTQVMEALEHAEFLSPVYHVVIANPPYLGGRNMHATLAGWAKKQYPDSKDDLCSMFMERGLAMVVPHGFSAMVTMQSWMFLGGQERLRCRLLEEADIVSLAHLGTRAFDQIGGEVVATCAFVMARHHEENYVADYLRLVDAPGSEKKALLCREIIAGQGGGSFFRLCSHAFSSIPGRPIAYWVAPNIRRIFEENAALGEHAMARNGMTTSDNRRFLRRWHEVDARRIGYGMASAGEFFRSGCRWAPYNKGGSFRKWYGNQEYVICYSQADYRLLKTLGNHCPSEQLYFLPSVSWGRIASAEVAYRYYPAGFVFDSAVNCAFGGSDEWKLGLLMYSNTAFVQTMSQVLNPTVNFQPGDYAKLPYADKAWTSEATQRASRLIELAREDWDAHEVSRDFETHPLLRAEYRGLSLAEGYAALRNHWRQMVEETARLEAENNRAFHELYGLEGEFAAELPPEQITLRCNPAYRYGEGKTPAEQEACLRSDTIRELISCAVGCMFGRYSLVVPGLVCAGGPCEPERYGDFPPDADNIIPICDEDYFPDDLCGRFVEFVCLAFGAERLEENLAFVAEALGGGRGTAREIIRAYFLKDFYADHCRLYGKRPIYWQFESGRKGGFRALVYLHRYERDTLARMRTDYVFRQQERYRAELAASQQRLMEATGRERMNLNRLIRKLSDQAEETASFEQRLHHLASQRISLDLDDGVSHNYEQFRAILSPIK